MPPPGLAAAQINVTYDPEIVSVLQCLPFTGRVCYPVGKDAVKLTGATSTGQEGDSVLAQVDVRCEQPGSSPLELEVVGLFDATIGDPQPIDAEITDGKITCASGPSPTPLSNFWGDVDCDFVVSAVDALLVLQIVAALLPTAPCMHNGDVLPNDGLNSIDGVLILQFSAGIIDHFPVEQG